MDILNTTLPSSELQNNMRSNGTEDNNIIIVTGRVRSCRSASPERCLYSYGIQSVCPINLKQQILNLLICKLQVGNTYYGLQLTIIIIIFVRACNDETTWNQMIENDTMIR